MNSDYKNDIEMGQITSPSRVQANQQDVFAQFSQVADQTPSLSAVKANMRLSIINENEDEEDIRKSGVHNVNFARISGTEFVNI